MTLFTHDSEHAAPFNRFDYVRVDKFETTIAHKKNAHGTQAHPETNAFVLEPNEHRRLEHI